MADGNDVNYWNLIFIGAMLLLAVIVVLMLRSKPRSQEMHDPTTDEGTRRVYEEEQRIHKRDPGSGL
ncbi:hypothetical protein [Sphingomonas arenae]|uniref:hypothetical protein n=1 Tax=Sphingomonas arenae TaxID=2812555 RepID=UPI001967DA37|nr:hypothetical protein [Sphingomonas arenae]